MSDAEETKAQQPYYEHFREKIDAEIAAISDARQEDGTPLPKKTAKKMEKGVLVKYKRIYQEYLQAQRDATVRDAKDALPLTMTEDPSLPPAARTDIEGFPALLSGAASAPVRVAVYGWCHRVRVASSKLAFVVLRDGTGFCQVVLGDRCMANQNAQNELKTEAAVLVKGALVREPRAKGGFEVQADYFELVGKSSGEFETRLTADSGPDVRARERHLVHRGEKGALILKLRSKILYAFRKYFVETKHWTEVTPPTIVNTCCEGGSTLFKLNYYGQEAYLTQSSQLYLESVIHALGNVFCVLPSYRAEKSNTRRHLAEFTHLETEHAFIDFDGLMRIIEDFILAVVDALRADPEAYEGIKALNPQAEEKIFGVIRRPFRRMRHSEGIDWLNSHGVTKEDGSAFTYDDDIAEAEERRMIDALGEPTFLTHFPAKLKAFYMQRCAEPGCGHLTESCDLLVPTVGEIVGGSMRIWGYEDTIKAYEKEGISLEHYYWYTDVRKFGAMPHGGMGLGVERLICWLLGIYNIRDATMYPRTPDRVEP